jgi:hypothetical protein
LPELTGRLGSRSGTVTANQSLAGLSQCDHKGLRDVHVAPTGARVVRDGDYALSGPGAQGTASVYGDGALLGYDASFTTPIGDVEDNPRDAPRSTPSPEARPGTGAILEGDMSRTGSRWLRTGRSRRTPLSPWALSPRPV